MARDLAPAARPLWRRLARRGAWLIGLAVAALAALAIPALRPPKARLLSTQPIEVRAEPIRHFAKADPARTRFGELEFRGGLVLSSPSPYFGGFSGLTLDAQGRRLLAVSDAGTWMTGELRYDAGRPQEITGAVIGPLLGADGSPYARGRDRDSEAIALVDGSLGGGEVLIAFEQHHRLGRFPVDARGVGAQRATLPLPPGTSAMERNAGLEAVCMVAAGPLAGSVVTLAERFPGTPEATATATNTEARPSTHSGWIGKPDGSGWRRLSLQVVDDHDLTDCHSLPDGGLLVLERRFRKRDWANGPRLRLRRLSAGDLAAGATTGQPMTGETLLAAGPGEELDNMEGVAVHSGPGGETVITLVSDDNFSKVLQRTVLLQFALPRAAQSQSQPQPQR